MGEPHKGYTLDENTLRSLLRDWDDLIDSYSLSLRRAFVMAKVAGPGADPASTSFASAANRSGQSYLDSLEHDLRFCTEQRGIFQKALERYRGIEDSAAAGFNQVTEQ